MDRIEQILWDIRTEDLTKLCSMANIKKSSGWIKEQKIIKLCEFYNNEDWAKNIYENLTMYEKDMMKCIIQNKYHPTGEMLKSIMNKYNRKTWGDMFDRDSKTKLFFLNGSQIPSEFRKQLNQLVEPLKIEIKPENKELDGEDFYANIIGRDNRVQDIDEFIKFINLEKIKATKAKGQLPKSTLIKIHKKLRYKDVLLNDEIDFENIRNIEDTIVSNSIMNLLTNSSIVQIKKGEFVIDELFCEDYQKLNKVEKIRYLLNSYTEENRISINECERIKENNFKIQNRIPEFGKARKIIIDYVKKCPIDKWINVNEIKKWIRINEYGFLREFTGEVLIKDQYYNSYYETASHDEFENSFIDIVIMEYLSTLGIVDVIIEKTCDDYGYKEFLYPEYFKITKFGSYVLGMAKENYDDVDNNEVELEVTKDFRIIIGKTNKKLKYELYFDRFLQKDSEEPLTYILNFKGMAKALELGIKLKEIFEYIESNSENKIPENVKAQFERWIIDSKKIKIKTITILELDRENFEYVVRNEGFQNYIDSVRNDVIVLKNNKIDSVKNELNKNGKFCL